MSEPILEQEWRRMRQAYPIYMTIQLTLLVVTLVELPTILFLYQQDRMIKMDGWIGLWAILEIFGISMGLILLVSRFWRQIPIIDRINPVFGFFAGSWIGLAALLFHFPTKTGFAYLTAGLGIVLVAAFLLVRRSYRKPEEIFP